MRRIRGGPVADPRREAWRNRTEWFRAAGSVLHRYHLGSPSSPILREVRKIRDPATGAPWDILAIRFDPTGNLLTLLVRSEEGWGRAWILDHSLGPGLVVTMIEPEPAEPIAVALDSERCVVAFASPVDGDASAAGAGAPPGPVPTRLLAYRIARDRIVPAWFETVLPGRPCDLSLDGAGVVVFFEDRDGLVLHLPPPPAIATGRAP